MMTTRNKTNVRSYRIAALLLAGAVFSPYSIINANAQANAQACTVSTAPGTSISFARQQFAQSCPNRIRLDCDLFQGGWQCSTESLPLSGGSTPLSTPTAPTTPVSGDAMLSVQAENAILTTGSGWSTERSLGSFSGSGYIVWRGSDDFRASDQVPPAGIKTYEFTVTTPGTYEFTARVQARVGNGSAANDKDNDAWVKFISGTPTAGVRGNSAKWTKFFVSGSDESWKNYSNGEQYDPTFFTEIQRDLPAGKHRIQIGGRSARFAIDSLGLQLIRATGQSAPAAPTIPAAPTTPVTPTPPTTPVASGSCSARGNSLQQAKNNYANSCPSIPRQDCDPVSGSNWLCSSANIGSGSQVAMDAPAPAPAIPTMPAQPDQPSIPVVSGACSAQGSSLQQARNNFANSCPSIPRQDCDPTNGGNWICSSGNIGASTQAVTTPTRTPTPASTPTPSRTGTIGRLTSGDLLVLHYDNCPDRDDGHAIASAKAVLDTMGISNPLVVNGTCGASIRSSYQPSSVNVLRAVFGNDWLDGFNNESQSVNTSADRWAATLANGDDVWVAEGGPSDFTAKVLRRIGSTYPSVDRKRVRVVQHSSGRGFNESNTSSAGIALVKQVADYITIPDGNNTNNGSADFNQKSSSFVSIARQSRYAREWNAAFDYLNPNRKLDFSDTVEIMYIINDTSTLTVTDFANRYLR